jgi:Co/Zn/Cd efflux system component
MTKPMFKTTFRITKMDCPSEENLIRMKLDEFTAIRSLEFDMPGRILKVYHTGSHEALLASLNTLDLDTAFLSSEPVGSNVLQNPHREQSRILWQVLGINFFCFVLEIFTGFVAGSMGLVADSLDMLADSIVYGLSLFAVGGSTARKKSVAGMAGYFQLILAILGFAEVVRRFVGHEGTPDFHLMIIISLVALVGNAACLYLLQRSRSKDAHMQASMIFTSTDVVVNLGVIAAGVAVYLTASKIPDLTIGTFVFVLVARGAYRILKLSK